MYRDGTGKQYTNKVGITTTTSNSKLGPLMYRDGYVGRLYSIACIGVIIPTLFVYFVSNC